jgi:hypothetical protein
MKEVKFLQIVFALLLIYGLSSYFEFQRVVFPLPAFEIIFAIGAISFSIPLFKVNKSKSALIMVAGLTYFLEQMHSYSFFLSDQQLEGLSNSIFTDVIGLLFRLSIIALVYLVLKKEVKENLGITVLILSLFLPVFWLSFWYFIPTLIFLVYLFFRKRDLLFVNGNGIFALLFLLEITKTLSLNFL